MKGNGINKILLSIILANLVAYTVQEPLNYYPWDPIILDDDHYIFSKSWISTFIFSFFAKIAESAFLVVMVYSMTKSNFKTFILSFIALYIANYIALWIGYCLPFFISRKILEWLAFIIFIVASIKMLFDATANEDRLLVKDYELQELQIRDKEKTKLDDEEYKDLRHALIIKDKEKEALGTHDPREVKVEIVNRYPKDAFNSFWSFSGALFMHELCSFSQIFAVLSGAIYNFHGALLGTSLAILLMLIFAVYSYDYMKSKFSIRQIKLTSGIVFLLFGVYFFLKIMGYLVSDKDIIV